MFKIIDGVNTELELIVKVKFWFGQAEDIFKSYLHIEYVDQYAYVYKIKECGLNGS